MKTIIKAIVVLVVYLVSIDVYGQQGKNSIACVVLEKNDEVKQANIKSIIKSNIEQSIVKNNEYELLAKEEEILKHLKLIREYEANSGNIDATRIREFGEELNVDFLCWIEVSKTDEIYIRLINVGTTRVIATANGYIQEKKLVITESTNNFLNDLIPPPLPPLTWNDFTRLYKEQHTQWFLTVGYGMNIRKDIIGNNIGLNFGGRFGNVWGGGFQIEGGLGISPNKTYYPYYSVGGKLYYTCVFLSASYGVFGMEKSHKIETLNTEDGYFTYYEKETKDFYDGFSLLAGTDYCFGKKTIDKSGGVVNIAIGTAYYGDSRWCVIWKIGIGWVF